MSYLIIGSAPCDEDCAQVGDINYHKIAREECNRFIRLIQKKLGPEPPAARLGVKSFPRDFGTYHEVVCFYDPENEKATEYAFDCEANAPTTWEDDGELHRSDAGNEGR